MPLDFTSQDDSPSRQRVSSDPSIITLDATDAASLLQKLQENSAPPSEDDRRNARTEAVKGLLTNMNEKFADAEPAPFRDELIERAISVMISRTTRSPLLVGSPGVGKTRVVEEIARRIVTGHPLIPEQLRECTIYELKVSDVIAGCMFHGELEAKISAIVDFASDPEQRAILFIDEIHQITGGSLGHGDPSARKISQIFKPALARGEMAVIGATTTTESRGFDADPALARRFARLVVDELTVEQTRQVLQSIRPGLLAHYRDQITVSDGVLAEVVRIADEKATAGQHRPDSAITLIDRALADRVLERRRALAAAEESGDQATLQVLQTIPSVPLTARRVRQVAERLSSGSAPAPRLDADAVRRELHDRLIGQETAIERVVDHLARRQLDLFPTRRPTTWLFAGASGVGKTETAKIVAEQVTGTAPIMLNMAEYQDQSSVAKLLGSPAGFIGSDSDQELPFDPLESDPHRVILLDEFEKAHPSVQRLFLAAFDEGSLRSARGKVFDLSRAIVVCTTNAGREQLDGRSIGFGDAPKTLSARSLAASLERSFDAELLGRMSMLVGFDPIDADAYRRIVMADYARDRAALGAARPELADALPQDMPEDEVEAMVAATFVPSQGARPAGRAVRSWIEDRLLAGRTDQIPSPATDTDQEGDD